MNRAVVLLSGGIDSATTLAIAKEEGYQVFALSFRYGQRHEIEIDSAEQVAKSLGVSEHRVIEIDLRQFGVKRFHLFRRLPIKRRVGKSVAKLTDARLE